MRASSQAPLRLPVRRALEAAPRAAMPGLPLPHRRLLPPAARATQIGARPVREGKGSVTDRGRERERGQSEEGSYQDKPREDADREAVRAGVAAPRRARAAHVARRPMVMHVECFSSGRRVLSSSEWSDSKGLNRHSPHEPRQPRQGGASSRACQQPRQEREQARSRRSARAIARQPGHGTPCVLLPRALIAARPAATRTSPPPSGGGKGEACAAAAATALLARRRLRAATGAPAAGGAARWGKGKERGRGGGQGEGKARGRRTRRPRAGTTTRHRRERKEEDEAQDARRARRRVS
jgi:hypothetical protein